MISYAASSRPLYRQQQQRQHIIPRKTSVAELPYLLTLLLRKQPALLLSMGSSLRLAAAACLPPCVHEHCQPAHAYMQTTSEVWSQSSLPSHLCLGRCRGCTSRKHCMNTAAVHVLCRSTASLRIQHNCNSFLWWYREAVGWEEPRNAHLGTASTQSGLKIQAVKI